LLAVKARFTGVFDRLSCVSASAAGYPPPARHVPTPRPSADHGSRCPDFFVAFYFGEAALADLVLVILGCLAALWLIALLFDSVPREKPMSRRERERAALEAEK